MAVSISRRPSGYERRCHQITQTHLPIDQLQRLVVSRRGSLDALSYPSDVRHALSEKSTLPHPPLILSSDSLPPRFQLFCPDRAIFPPSSQYSPLSLSSSACNACLLGPLNCGLNSYSYDFSFNSFEPSTNTAFIKAKKSCADPNTPPPPRQSVDPLTRSQLSRVTAFPVASRVLRPASPSCMCAFWAG